MEIQKGLVKSFMLMALNMKETGKREYLMALESLSSQMVVSMKGIGSKGSIKGTEFT
jgi:hypothetical protein